MDILNVIFTTNNDEYYDQEDKDKNDEEPKKKQRFEAYDGVELLTIRNMLDGLRAKKFKLAVSYDIEYMIDAKFEVLNPGKHVELFTPQFLQQFPEFQMFLANILLTLHSGTNWVHVTTVEQDVFAKKARLVFTHKENPRPCLLKVEDKMITVCYLDEEEKEKEKVIENVEEKEHDAKEVNEHVVEVKENVIAEKEEGEEKEYE